MKKRLLVLVCVVISATQNVCMDKAISERVDQYLIDKQWKKLDQCLIDKQRLSNLRSSASKAIFVLNCAEILAEELGRQQQEKRQHENIQRTCARYRLTKSKRNSLKFTWK
jgi:hypothetical protein